MLQLLKHLLTECIQKHIFTSRKITKTFFFLKSDKTLPSIKEMQSFRKGFFKLVLKIKFRKIRCGYLVKFI